MNIKRNSFRAVLGTLAVSIAFFGLANRAGAVEAPGDLLINNAADLQIDHSGTTEPSTPSTSKPPSPTTTRPRVVATATIRLRRV